MNKKLSKTLFLLLVALASGGVRPSFAAGPPSFGPMTVQGAAVRAEDLPVTLDAVGTLAASESAEVRAEIAGTIVAAPFKEGQPVQKGDSLAAIDDSLVQAELKKAQATYNVRKTTFSRSDKLKASGYLSSQDWEQNKSSLQEAEADIESARIRIEKAKVRAPFDGIAGLRNFSYGDYVQVGQLLTTVDAIDPIKITFSVAEKSYGDIREGQHISFSVDAWPGDLFDGEIYAISPRINEGTRSFDVKAVIPNKAARLRPGMFARIKIVTALHRGAFIVPEQAIVPMGNDSFVFAVRDGKAALQKVGTGLRAAGAVEITSGLSATDTVVTAGTMKIQDGMPVKVEGPGP